MGDEIQDTDPARSLELTIVDAQPEGGVDLDRDSVELALRFLTGLLALCGDGAARRLQAMQRELDADPSLWGADPSGRRKPSAAGPCTWAWV